MQQQDFYLILSTIQQLFLLSLITIEEKGQLKDFYLNSNKAITDLDELTNLILQQVTRLRRSHNKKMSISTELTAIGEETGEEGDFE